MLHKIFHQMICALEMDSVTSALVLLCKMRCMFFFTVKTRLCVLPERVLIPFSPFLPVLFCGDSLYLACLA